jgi:hypothetical protein
VYLFHPFAGTFLDLVMTSISTGDRTPPGQHAPFATISDDDHSAWIIITSAIGIAFGLVTLTTRIFIRWFGDMSWGLDDSMTVITTVRFSYTFRS